MRKRKKRIVLLETESSTTPCETGRILKISSRSDQAHIYVQSETEISALLLFFHTYIIFLSKNPVPTAVKNSFQGKRVHIAREKVIFFMGGETVTVRTSRIDTEKNGALANKRFSRLLPLFSLILFIAALLINFDQREQIMMEKGNKTVPGEIQTGRIRSKNQRPLVGTPWEIRQKIMDVYSLPESDLEWIVKSLSLEARLLKEVGNLKSLKRIRSTLAPARIILRKHAKREFKPTSR